jgi:dihydroneopterin aldolase
MPADVCAWRLSGYGLHLQGIRLLGRVGVTDAERATPQALVVDVDVRLDGDSYPFGDDLAQAVDYAEVVHIVETCLPGDGDRLLETFALRVGRRLGDRWPVADRIRVACTKAHIPTMPNTDKATVEITLGRSGA